MLTSPIPSRVFAKLGGNYLAGKGVRIANFVDLVDFLTWERTTKDGIIVYTLDECLRDNLKDVIEKFGFVVLSRNLCMKVPTHIEGKHLQAHGYYRSYYFSNLVLYTKATLDLVAVTLNSFSNLGFTRGNIDFAKGKFADAVGQSFPSFRRFQRRYGKWIRQLVEYRDALIHKKSVDLYKNAGRSGDSVPNSPLTHTELIEIEIMLGRIPIHERKTLIDKIRPVSIDSLMMAHMNNLREIIGLMATDLLVSLRARYPKHRFSRKTYG